MANFKVKDGITIGANGITFSDGSTQTQAAASNTTSTSSNTVNTIVLRNSAGGFSAGAIIGESFTGNLNASNVSSGTLDNARTTASSSNGASTIVARDAAGAFATGSIVATGNSVITVADNTNAALRITQTGTGNAILVEDSANPDATPFVVDANGLVVVGHTSAIPAYGFNNQFEVLSTSNSYQLNAAFRNDAFAPLLTIAHSRNASIGSHTVLQSGDETGILAFAGSDGTAFIRTAQIISAVDGTPGTNDMPGRLVFSTTADGASSPTERMRIDSSGLVGIGGSSYAGVTLRAVKSITGSTFSTGILSDGTVQSDVTGAAYYFQAATTTAASAFTTTTVAGFLAKQNTIGAGSTVTGQYGFIADSTLTGATNNYGFYSNIASGTGRWNFYAAGTAQNHFAGNVLIGSTSATPNGKLTVLADRASISYNTVFSTYNGASFENDFFIGFNGTVTNVGNYQSFPIAFITNNTERMRIDSAGNVGIGGTSSSDSLYVVKNITGSTSSSAIVSAGTVQSTVTSAANYFTTYVSTVAAFTLSNLYHYRTQQGTFSGTVTNQFGFLAESTLTGATNNYGFYSNIASGTGRWNFYANGTAANYFAGRVGIGDTTDVGAAVFINYVIAGSGGVGYGIKQNNTATSAVTSSFIQNESVLYTQATSFTLASYKHFSANQGIVGAGSTVTNQYGFVAESTVTGATNNYGFLSNIASGTGRWNFYANGTAANFFAGRVSIGDGTDTGAALFINSSIAGSGGVGYGIKQHNSIASTVTSTYHQNQSTLYTQAASFTLNAYKHFTAEQGSIGAGSTVSNQYGFIVESSLTGATNNFGFFSNIASGSGRWNFYANGTAANYFAGTTFIGTTTNTNSSALVVNGTISATVGGTQYLVVDQSDIGTGANEIPLNQYLGANAYVDTETPALNIGTGITTGTGTICKANGGLSGGIYRATILIDLTGLNSGGTAGDIIGVNGTALPCYIAQLPAMTVLGGRMTCLETPAGGDTDIDLYAATEATGVEDQAVSALTETEIINAGAQTRGTVTYFSADPVTNGYLYLVGQGVANATYTAGRFLIEIFGVQ